jgi:hypothetical protein
VTADGPEDGPPSMVPFAEWTAVQPPPADERNDQTAAARDAVRRDGRMTAMVLAAAHALPFVLVMYLSAGMAANSATTHSAASWTYATTPPQPPPYLTWLLAIGITCWAVCTLAELVHAGRLAGDYSPRGPWARITASPILRIVRRTTGRMDRRISAGGGCLGVLALAVLGPAVVLTWSALAAYAAPVWVLAVGAAAVWHLSTLI